MNTIEVNGQSYAFTLKAKAIKSFESKTGVSLFKLTKDDMKRLSFTDTYDFVLLCSEDSLTENILDELDWLRVVELFNEMITGKKPQASTQEVSTTSEDSPTETELLQENGQPPLKVIETSQNTSYMPLNEEQREKMLKEHSEVQ
jgi:hypothetical protein